MNKLINIIFFGAILAAVVAQESSTAPPKRPPFPEEIPPRNETVDPSIVNGQRAAPGEIPWQAVLFTTVPEGVALCGGSLIRPTWVMTAAHCIDNEGSTEVRMGGTNRNQMSYSAVASRRIMHEGYNRQTLENDVALVQLPSAPSGEGIAVITMADMSVGTLENVIMRVSGYGNVATEGPTSDDLLKVNLRGISNEECAQTAGYVPESNLCATWSTEPGQSICQGDSGGPLTVQQGNGEHALAGVVSFTLGSCHEGNPQGFARVSSFNSWVEQTIQQNS